MQTQPAGPANLGLTVPGTLVASSSITGSRPPRPEPGGLGDRLEQAVMDGFGPGRGNYVLPSRQEQETFRAVVADTLRGLREGDTSRVEQARAQALLLGYSLSDLDDGGEKYLALREIGQGRGWPSVVFNVHPQGGVVVEAPHTGFDLGTPELGWRAFKAFHAEVYIVAGAHRANRTEPSPDVPHDGSMPEYSISDPTHARDSLFQAAHQASTGEGSRVLQVHGFSAGKHHAQNPAFPVDQQAVLSDAADDGYNACGLPACRDALEQAGFKSRVVTFDGPMGADLGATPNVQHRDMAERDLVGRGRPGEFIHIELDTAVRKGPHRDANFDHIVNALAPIFLPPPDQACPSPTSP